MKLERNIKKFPPLARRLDRRFALPRALAIFQRLSTRLGLRRVWPDLPYMSFVRGWASRPVTPGGETRPVAAREAVVLRHSSFHTHIAFSPVVTRLVRETYTLPVRELRLDRPAQLQLERTTPVARLNENASSRLVTLVRVVERVRPATVRALRSAEDLVAATRSSRRAHHGSNDDSVGSIQPIVDSTEVREAARVLREDQETLQTAAREFGLEPATFDILQNRFLKPDANESPTDPILPSEIEEHLQFYADAPRSERRFVAKRRGSVASDSGDDSARNATRTTRAHKPASDADAKELVLSSGVKFAQSGAGRDRTMGVDTTTVTERQSVRPVLERESGGDGAAHATKPGEAVPTAVVQEAVRRTLRTLPEPDVEAFADRISRTIERRLQIDRDWRGDL